MSLFDKIKAQKAANEKAGIYPTIPLVKDEKGIGVDKAVEKPPEKKEAAPSGSPVGKIQITEKTKEQINPSPITPARRSLVPSAQKTIPLSGAGKPVAINTGAVLPANGKRSLVKPGGSGNGANPGKPGQQATPTSVSELRTVQSVEPPVPAKSGGISVSQVGKLKVDLNTFERGSEKYTKEEIERLQHGIQMLENNFTNKQIVGNHLKIVMASILENPNLKEIIDVPATVGLMVKALRASYELHVAKADTRANSRSQNKQFKNEILDILKGVNPSGDEIDLDSLGLE